MCKDCKGTGKITLFTSTVDCDCVKPPNKEDMVRGWSAGQFYFDPAMLKEECYTYAVSKTEPPKLDITSFLKTVREKGIFTDEYYNEFLSPDFSLDTIPFASWEKHI